MCVCERESVCMRESVCECVCVRERVCVCVRERESVCERERESVCVCVRKCVLVRGKLNTQRRDSARPMFFPLTVGPRMTDDPVDLCHSYFQSNQKGSI